MMEKIDLTSDALFLRDIHIKNMPQEEIDHYLERYRGDSNILGEEPKFKIRDIIFLDKLLIPSECSEILSGRDSRGIDYDEAYANIIGYLSPKIEIPEYTSEHHCDRCGTSLETIDYLGEGNTSLCYPCDESLEKESAFSNLIDFGVLGTQPNN